MVESGIRDLSPYLLRYAKEVNMESDRNILVGWIDQWIRHPPPRNPIPKTPPKNVIILSQERAKRGRRANRGFGSVLFLSRIRNEQEIGLGRKAVELKYSRRPRKL